MTNVINIFDHEYKTFKFDLSLVENAASPVRVAVVITGSDRALVITGDTERKTESLAIAKLYNFHLSKITDDERDQLNTDLSYGHNTLTEDYFAQAWTSGVSSIIKEIEASKNTEMFSELLETLRGI